MDREEMRKCVELQQAGNHGKALRMMIQALRESPDDETIARVALTTSSRGDIHTETLRAFTEEEYRRIVDKLP